MVNTRSARGSIPGKSNLRTTREKLNASVRDISSSSESDESHPEDNSYNSNDCKNLRPNAKLVLPRVRELRSRFAYNKYDGHRGKKHNSRTRHLINQTRSMKRYTLRKIPEDTDSSNPNFEEEMCSYRRNTHRLQRLAANLNRIERRSALSLRPISRKNYIDESHSPLAFNSDEGQRKYPKRKRAVRFKNTSWLADDQMHKVGYPNLIPLPYSEEDSRDAQENSHADGQIRRSTRQINDSKCETKKKTGYRYDSEDSDLHQTSRNDSSIREESSRELRSKKVKRETFAIRRLRSQGLQVKTEIKEEKEDDLTFNSSNGVCEKNDVNKDEKDDDDDTKMNCIGQENGPSNKDSSDSDAPLRLPRTRAQATNNNQQFRILSSRKDLSSSDSTEEEEEGDTKKQHKRRRKKPTVLENSIKTYSFRQRPLKPPQSTRQNFSLPQPQRSIRVLRKRVRRSSSSSTSSSDESVRTYSKVPKGTPCKSEQRMKRKSVAGGSNFIPIGPETLDGTVRFHSIGGLDNHIQCLKEMIILPMLYPEVFEQFHITPPRGVLFHGPPGTGKTLIARALANECSLGKRKIAFFMRKGADLLSKWIGESEKQLRLLFEQAAKMKPSIIFFDELDGLVPVRSSRNDQIHASIVSTLLALLDGLDDRGEIIVIGATNRIDAIDPAFRRPGRFDRELYFPLPAQKEREEILSVHVSKWLKRPNQQLLSYLAEHAVGYCGSDLKALCTEAVIQSFKRTYPQVYHSEQKLLLNPDEVNVKKLDFMRAKSAIVPAAHRTNQCISRKLLPILEPLLGDHIKNIFALLENSFPHGVQQKLARVKLSANMKPAHVLLVGDGSYHGQTRYLAPALIHRMEHIQCYTLNLSTLYKESSRSQEEATLQVFTEAKSNVPSVIYIPSIDKFWNLVSDTTKAILLDQLNQLDPYLPILLFTTADTLYKNLPEKVKKLFSTYLKEVYEIKLPSTDQRRAFFKSLIIDGSLKPLRIPRQRIKTPPPLPRAPTPPPIPPTEEELKKIYEKEEHTLRELRIFLRDMCRKLAQNRMFYIFTKPVDLTEVPDYTTIIKKPMDLETMMMKVDFHQYECAKDFLSDIELIVQNALEYNPARTSVDKQIRHRACSLRDYAYTLIKTEMDSDFEGKCQDISKSRKSRQTKVSHLPEYLVTPEIISCLDQIQGNDLGEPTIDSQKCGENETPKISSKKRRTGSWQRGFVRPNKRRKKEKSLTENDSQKIADNRSSDDESKENNPYLDADKMEQVENLSRSILNSTRESSKSHIENSEMNGSRSEATVLHSPRRRLSDILSPSELLEDPLYFDDVDQALNESGEYTYSKENVECSLSELETVLDQIVKFTAGYTLQALLDLYNQLRKIIGRYLRTRLRNNLPKDLQKEMNRFKKEEFADIQSDSSQSSINSNLI